MEHCIIRVLPLFSSVGIAVCIKLSLVAALLCFKQVTVLTVQYSIVSHSEVYIAECLSMKLIIVQARRVLRGGWKLVISDARSPN